MGAFAPLIGEVLGVKRVPIHYAVDGKRRSAEIPGIMAMAVRPIASAMGEDVEMVAVNAHPFAPDGVVMAVGEAGYACVRLRDAVGQLRQERLLRADPLVERLTHLMTRNCAAAGGQRSRWRAGSSSCSRLLAMLTVGAWALTVYQARTMDMPMGVVARGATDPAPQPTTARHRGAVSDAMADMAGMDGMDGMEGMDRMPGMEAAPTAEPVAVARAWRPPPGWRAWRWTRDGAGTASRRSSSPGR